MRTPSPRSLEEFPGLIKGYLVPGGAMMLNGVAYTNGPIIDRLKSLSLKHLCSSDIARCDAVFRIGHETDTKEVATVFYAHSIVLLALCKEGRGYSAVRLKAASNELMGGDAMAAIQSNRDSRRLFYKVSLLLRLVNKHDGRRSPC